MPASASLSRKLEGTPPTEGWYWFMCRGPHGSSFTWGASRLGPPSYVGIEHLRKVIDERTANDSDTPVRLRAIARAATGSSDAEVMRRALQVLAVVGTNEDVPLIEGLAVHSRDVIARDAKAALFELKRLLRREGR
jgi:hypothetical protein